MDLRSAQRGPHDAEVRTDSAPPHEEMPLRTRWKRPVLIVDDDDEILEAERMALTEHGFRVVQARNGAEALRAVSRELPACVVLDIQMPGLDGRAFAAELKRQLRHVPLVVLTGLPDPKREADRCNAEAYLRKPFDVHEFVRLVTRFSA